MGGGGGGGSTWRRPTTMILPCTSCGVSALERTQLRFAVEIRECTVECTGDELARPSTSRAVDYPAWWFSQSHSAAANRGY